MFPGFAFYECKGERERGRDKASQTGLNWWHRLLSEGGGSGVSTEGYDTERERKRDAVFADDPSLSTVTTKNSHHLEEFGFRFLSVSKSQWKDQD